MIERYSLPAMKAIWEQRNKYQKWLDVEIAVAEGLAEFGYIPKDAPAKIKSGAKFDVARILEKEWGEMRYIPIIIPGKRVVGEIAGGIVTVVIPLMIAVGCGEKRPVIPKLDCLAAPLVPELRHPYGCIRPHVGICKHGLCAAIVCEPAGGIRRLGAAVLVKRF